MAVKNYFTEDGVITGTESGGTYTDYLSDALGSVTATVNQSQSVVNNYRYKPYGSRLAKTGAGADPSFQWVGGYGYNHTGLTHSSHYIRARHYGQEEGRWTTVDQKWPTAPAYNYTYAAPTRNVDPSGLMPDFSTCASNPDCKTSVTYTTVESALKIICQGADKDAKNITRCVQRANKATGRSVSAPCIVQFCSTQGKVVCEQCKDKQDFPCPTGCKCLESVIRMPSCSYTRCSKSMPMPRTITLCCNASSSEVYKRCKCGFPDPESVTDCDSPYEVGKNIAHELVHACQEDCAHDKGSEGAGDINDKWAKIFYDCMRGRH